jgi:4-hydroxybenzoate polyprenyltransferase
VIASRRWQDWANIAIGIVLLVAPFVLATSISGVAAYTAYTLGALVLLVGIVTVVFPEFKIAEFGQLILGLVLFFSPWLVGFTGDSAMSWTAWLVGIVMVLIVGSEYIPSQGQGRFAPTT